LIIFTAIDAELAGVPLLPPPPPPPQATSVRHINKQQIFGTIMLQKVNHVHIIALWVFQVKLLKLVLDY